MKHSIMIAAGLVLLFTRCKQPTPAAPPPFLPGMYVNRSENEFCQINDTLIVQRQSLDRNGYSVIRRTSFQRFRQGKAGEIEYQQDTWQAGFDGVNNALLSVGKTNELRYTPETNKLFKGEWEYEKVQ